MNSNQTFDKLATEYMEMYAKINQRPETYQKSQQMLDEIILKRLGSQKTEDITTDDIRQLHQELRDTPYMANRVLALLNKMFSFALRWKWGTMNPVEGINKHEEQRRNRKLNDQELQRLFSVVETYPNQNAANAIRLLFLTGSRRSEVLGATWDQFDFEKGVWTKPSHMTKQNRLKHISLSFQTIEFLKHMKAQATSPTLFPKALLKDINKDWEAIRIKANIPEILLSDLRHAHVPHLAQAA